jgi:hypothetical protein
MKNIISNLSQRQNLLKNIKNNEGQTLYYFLVLVIILIISWAMMLNIASLIRNRMVMQNKADNIALSLATYKARTLNFLGGINYVMGVMLSLGTNPRGIQLASYSTDIVGGYPATMISSAENPLSDLKHKVWYNKQNSGVKKIKGMIDSFQKFQDAAIKGYNAHYFSALKDNISKDYNIALFPLKPEKNLGLKRNSKGIQYYSTINAPCKMPLGEHFHLLARSKYARSSYSWFVEGNNFSQQKIRVILRQKTGKKMPLFAKLLDIKYPEIMVYSAAAPYNTKGSMFPKKEDTFTGATKTTVALVEMTSAWQLALMEKAILKIPLLGEFLAIAPAADYAESKRETLKLLNNNKDNPVDAYLDAKNGGWAAHLVPYNNESESDDEALK